MGYSLGRISDIQRPGTRVEPSVIGFHGLMEHNLVPTSVDFNSQITTFVQSGQDGKGDGETQIQKLPGPGIAVTDIINDECDTVSWWRTLLQVSGMRYLVVGILGNAGRGKGH